MSIPDPKTQRHHIVPTNILPSFSLDPRINLQLDVRLAKELGDLILQTTTKNTALQSLAWALIGRAITKDQVSSDDINNGNK